MSSHCLVEEEIYTHEYLWRSATAISNRLSGGAEDSHHLLLPALLSTYLAYEAFINFCGYVLLPNLWAQEKENFKGKSLEHKIEVIAGKLPKFEWRKGERPYQTVERLSAFRELVAHGKVQTKKYIADHKDDGTHFTFGHAWDSYLSSDEVLRFRSDTKAFCESILVAARHANDHPHLVFAAFEGSLATATSTSHFG